LLISDCRLKRNPFDIKLHAFRINKYRINENRINPLPSGKRFTVHRSRSPFQIQHFSYSISIQQSAFNNSLSSFLHFFISSI